MITKKNKVERRFLYREILNKISTHTNEMLVQGVLIDEHKELEISIILEEDIGVFPKVKEIIVTTSDNFNDIGVINNLLNMFS